MIDWVEFVEQGGDITDHTVYPSLICDACKDGFHEQCQKGIYSKETLKWSGCNQKYCQCPQEKHGIK